MAPVVIFNENLAKVAEQYLKKGAKVYIEGQLQTRKWQDQSGQDKYSTEVVLQRFRGELTMLDGRGGGGAGDFGDDQGGGQISRGGDFGSSSPMERRSPAPASGGGSKYGDIDDESRSRARLRTKSKGPVRPGLSHDHWRTQKSKMKLAMFRTGRVARVHDMRRQVGANAVIVEQQSAIVDIV